MSRNDLSDTMLSAIQTAGAHAGKLVRLPGGFWTYEGCERHAHNGVPHWHVGTTTIEALVKRGGLTYTDWKESKRGKFPIEARINTTAAPPTRPDDHSTGE